LFKNWGKSSQLPAVNGKGIAVLSICCIIFKKFLQMSHGHLRKERNCLNCGTYVQGRYCQNCGQENIEPKETFWGMVTHFVADIFHYDGKFASSLRILLFRPGFLTKEYISGKRVKYLPPVRMYVFTSAVFFLFYFSFLRSEGSVKINMGNKLSKKERTRTAKLYAMKIKTDANSAALQEQYALLMDSAREDLTANDLPDLASVVIGSPVLVSGNYYNRVEEYDSLQKTLPRKERDGWFTALLTRRLVDLNLKYRGTPGRANARIWEAIVHRVPYMLFISLPIFALLLRLLYIRRKQFIFMDHAVFTLHLYIFCFVVTFLVFLINKIATLSGWNFLNIFSILLSLCIPFYLYKAMRYYYEQRRAKTILKFSLLLLMSLLLLILFAIIVFLYAAFTI